MRKWNVPVRVVFYREDDRIIAHSLEFDLIGDGETHEDAMHNLINAIVLQAQESFIQKNRANLFSPADADIFEMFAAGKEYFVGEMKITHDVKVDGLTLEDFMAREFTPDAEESALACV